MLTHLQAERQQGEDKCYLEILWEMFINAKTCVYLLASLVTTVSMVGEKAFEACKNYGKTMMECHNILHPASRVRVPIDLLLYPHMVLIGFRKQNESAAWKCGGTLISPNWVLTAAHCKEDPNEGPASILRIGIATFEFEEVEDLEQEREVAQIVVHPGFKPPSKYHDIALIKSDSDFILNRDIRIACLNLNDDSIDGAKLTAIGFGTTVAGLSKGSQTLMKVDIDVVHSTICNRSMKILIRRKVLEHGITDNQLCAGDYENGGKDTCQGDSGGPLLIMEDKVDCVKTFPLHNIIGVTSFGRDCGRKWAPGVYTRVSKYIEWIEDIVWPN